MLYKLVLSISSEPSTPDHISCTYQGNGSVPYRLKQGGKRAHKRDFCVGEVFGRCTETGAGLEPPRTSSCRKNFARATRFGSLSGQWTSTTVVSICMLLQGGHESLLKVSSVLNFTLSLSLYYKYEPWYSYR